MFYSGWQFRTPTSFDVTALQNLRIGTGTGRVGVTPAPVIVQVTESGATPIAAVTSGFANAATAAPTTASAHDASVQLTLSGSPPRAGEGRGRGISSSAFHLRTNTALANQLGVAYMEVQIEQLGSRSSTSNDGSNETATSATSAQPSLVVGVCTSNLPPYRLPGEQEDSIGLFFTPLMVYAHGTGTGERVTLPSVPTVTASNGTGTTTAAHENVNKPGGRQKRGLRPGDALGVLVNFIEGTVEFTYNGARIDGGRRRVGKAARMFMMGKGAGTPHRDSSPLSFSPWRGDGMGGKVKPTRSISNCSEAREYYFAIGLQHRCTSPLTLRVVLQSGVLSPALGSRVPRPTPTIHAADSEAVPLLQREATATERGTAFDLAGYVGRQAVQQLEQQQPRYRDRSWQESTLHDASVQAVLRQFFAARGMTHALASLEREAAQLSPADSMKTSTPSTSPSSPSHTSEADATAVYSETIAEARRLLMASPEKTSNFSPSFLLSHHVLPPSLRAAFYAALRVDTAAQNFSSEPQESKEPLPPSFWGLLLFSRRMDLLFALKALQAVEITLDTVHHYLADVRARHAGAGHGHDNRAGNRRGSHTNGRPANTCGYRTAYATPSSDFGNPSLVESRLLAAYSAAVLLPLEDLQRRAARTSVGLERSRRHGHHPTPSSTSETAEVSSMYSWEQLAQLPVEALRDCFRRCLRTSRHCSSATSPGGTASDFMEDAVGRAELAATVLLSASVPLMAAPSTATQLRLGEALASFYAHTYAFFTELNRELAATGASPPQQDEQAVMIAEHEEQERLQEKQGHNASSPPQSQSLLLMCLEKWAELMCKARMQCRRCAFALLQRCLEECALWVSSTLQAWTDTHVPPTWRKDVGVTSESSVGDEEEDKDSNAALPKRVSRIGPAAAASEEATKEKHEMSAHHENSSAPRHTNKVSGSEEDTNVSGKTTNVGASLLDILTHPPILSDGLREAVEQSPHELRRLIECQPPSHPSLRAVHRRCLALASMEPLHQAHTQFFLSQLRAAIRLVDGRVSHGLPASSSHPSPSTAARGRGTRVSHSGAAGALKRPSVSVAGAGTSPEGSPTPSNDLAPSTHATVRLSEGKCSCTAHGLADGKDTIQRAGWAADEFYLASLILQRVHRSLFP